MWLERGVWGIATFFVELGKEHLISYKQTKKQHK